MKSYLILDEKEHIYRFGNRVVPNVTSILQSNFGVKPYWNEKSRQKGLAIHKCIHMHEKKEINSETIDWLTVDERIRGRLQGYIRFIRETGYTVIRSEMQLFSKRYQFAGTLDLWVRDPKLERNGNIIVDIKPPSPEPIVELQLAAYAMILQENTGTNIKRATAVCLKDNGRYSLKWVHNLKHAQTVFKACLSVSNWKNEYQR